MGESQGYEEQFSFASFERDAAGVLEVTLHDGEGGSFVWTEETHRRLPILWNVISNDYRNKVVILTGTGSEFCHRLEPSSFRSNERGWERIYSEGKRLLMGLLDVEVPMIAAVNGPATIHAELPLLCDVVLCSDNAVFADPHFTNGTVPGDGAHVVWPTLLGPNRGRAFLMTGGVINADQALAAGLVLEVLAPADLLSRARAIASQIALQDTKVLRMTRAALTQQWKTLLTAELGYGLMLEGYAIS